MQLESALRSSSLGIASHGKAISVVGDNISNVSTYGYKKSRAEFVDIFAEGRGIKGGNIARAQAGDGAAVPTVRQIHTTGLIEETGRNLDIAIDGEGFLMVGDAAAPSFTRSGILTLDAEGTLTDSQGNPVLGFGADVQNGTVADLGALSTNGVDLTATATTAMSISGVLDSTLPIVEALPAEGSTMREVGSTASFTYSTPVTDSLGENHPVTFAFFKTANNTWTVRGYIEGSEVGGEANTAIQVAPDTVLNFDENGGLIGDAANLEFAIPYDNGAAAGAVVADITAFNQLAAPSAVTSVTTDGTQAALVDGLEFDEQGNVIVVFADGRNQILGSLALADFPSVDNLARQGDLQFEATEAAGELVLGQANTAGFGTIRSGSLERSTVDIAEEFVNMVVFQRGYEANSQTFSATSTLLQQTIQLIR